MGLMGALTEEQRRFVERVDAGVSVWDETESLPDEEIPAKAAHKKMIAVRLTAGQWTMLSLAAREMGIGPATLSRIWILERLKPMYAAVAGGKGGWRRWRSRDPEHDEQLYHRLLAGEPVAVPSGAVYHRLTDEGYELGWDQETGQGWVIVKRPSQPQAG